MFDYWGLLLVREIVMIFTILVSMNPMFSLGL